MSKSFSGNIETNLLHGEIKINPPVATGILIVLLSTAIPKCLV